MRNLKKVLSLALCLVMLLGMMVVGAGAVETSFPDNNEIEEMYKEAVAVMNALKIFEGSGTEGKLYPKDTLTRAEAAKIMTIVMLGKGGAKGFESSRESTYFTDMKDPSVNWACGYVDYCASVGIIKGNTATTVNPKGTLRAVDFATMLLRASGIPEASTLEGANFEIRTIAAASKYNIEDVSYAPVTREAAAKMALEGIQVSPSGEKRYAYNGKNYDSFFEAYLVASKNPATAAVEVAKITPVTAKDSLASKNFGLHVSDTEKTDKFGNSVKVWVSDKDKDLKVVIETGGVKTYTTATKGSDIAKDLSVSASGTKATLTVDGKETVSAAADKKLNAPEFNSLGGNGALVNVYKTEDGVAITVVNTYLGTIKKGSYKEADISKDQKEQVTITTGTVKAAGEAGSEYVFATSKFSKDDEEAAVLYQVAWDAAAETPAYKVVKAEFPKEVTGTPTRSAATSFVMDGTTYKYSFKSEIDKDDVSPLVSGKTETTFYADDYGYIIGAKAATTPEKVYAVLSDVSANAGWSKTEVLVRLIEMDGTIVEKTVTKLNGATTNAPALTSHIGEFVKVEPDGGDKIKLLTTDGGAVNLDGTGTTAVSGASAIVTRNNPALDTNSEGFSGKTANSKTVFLLEKDGEVTAYTGISKVPTVKYVGNTACGVFNGTVAVAVYIKDGQIVGGSSTVEDIIFVSHQGKVTETDVDKGTFDTYYAVVNGEVTTIEADTSLNLMANKLYASVLKNDKDLVTGGTELVDQAGVVALKKDGVITAPDKGLIELEDTTYVYDETTLVYVVGEDGKIKDGAKVEDAITTTDANDAIWGYTKDGLLVALFVQKVAGGEPHVHAKGDKVNAVAATCTTGGNVEYYKCGDGVSCTVKLDANGDPLANQTVATSALGHTKGTHHDAVAADCTDEGNVEYWDCGRDGCSAKVDTSAEAIADVTTPIDSTNHVYTGDFTDNAGTHERACSKNGAHAKQTHTGAVWNDGSSDWTTQPTDGCNLCKTEADKHPS